jgi:hypothetical protein
MSVDREHDEEPDRPRCRKRSCANSLHADQMARFYGEVCDDCEAEADRTDRIEAEEPPETAEETRARIARAHKRRLFREAFIADWHARRAAG